MIADFDHHAMHIKVEVKLVELLREEGIVYTTAQMAEMSWHLTEAIRAGCTRAAVPASPPEMMDTTVLEAVSRVIMVERARCAALARKLYKDTGVYVGRSIAEAIERGDEPQS